MLTERDKLLVQTTFDMVRPIADDAAALFYGRLFEIAPELQPMFAHVEMRDQGRKLMKVLGVAVAALNKPEQLFPAVQDLGRRHAQYGVQPEDYDTVGTALLWTLEQGLGDAFTPEVRAAWVKVYTLLSCVAIEGNYPANPELN